MSSPAPSSLSIQSISTRNPRRRQRNPAEDGSLRQQPQRKRNKVTGDTFKPITEPQINGDAPHTTNGLLHSTEEQGLPTAQPLDMPLRGKHTGKRGPKDDGSIILTKNANYVVKQLPSLPENVRLSRKGDYRGAFLATAGYALVITHTQALVWDYTSTVSSPATRIFTLPHPARLGEPLPIGMFVAAASTNETGLIIINATSGKITFWESVENADALSLFEQRRNGIEGSCGSLLSGEVVVDLVNAEHAGFILTFNTGRTAQLLLRDTQSRPTVSVKFLREQKGATGRGFFGGLKSVFTGAGWLKNIAAVRAHPSTVRGCMDVVISNEDGLFQFWQLSWSGQATLQREVDVRTTTTTIAALAIPEMDNQNREVKILDFVIVSNKNDRLNALVSANDSIDNTASFDFMVLVHLVGAGQSTYALVELEIDDNLATARRTIQLQSYANPVIAKAKWRPKIYLPSHSETAFVTFEKAIVLVSLATVRLSPESQILMDAARLPEPFQDTIYLRDEHNYCVAGVVSEENSSKNRQSSIVLFVENFGLVRITTTEPASEEQSIERARVSVKSKIEQAVFFGTWPGNPLDLSRESDYVFAVEEVEAAALDISKEVCATETSFVSSVATSMDFHLEQRARILKDLALHLKQSYTGISRITWWKLRWDAEKMASARKVWTLYDLRAREAESKMRLLPQVLFLLHSRFKTPVDNDQGERDSVRQWFLKDVGRMENIVAWPWRAIRHLEQEKEVKDATALFELLGDACDIVLGCLETAFAFRAESAALYSLDSETLTDGILQSGYEDLPEFWTSTYAMLKMFPHFINGLRERLLDAGEPVSDKMIQRIARDNARLIDVYCKSSEERYRWASVRPSEKDRSAAEDFKQGYAKTRSNMIEHLTDLSLTTTGMTIAEKYHDMEALVYLVRTESAPVGGLAAEDEDAIAQDHAVALERRIKRYFNDYGDEWANAFYSSQIADGKFTNLLNQTMAYKTDLTRFLRADASRKKLSWINDIVGEKDYTSAGQTLSQVAETQEHDLWSKKVELSLAKLAIIAGQTNSTTPGENAAPGNAVEGALELVKLQEKVFDHIRPSLYNAVDQPAELQLAMESFGRHTNKGRLALQQLLERSMESLIKHSAMTPDQLIDLLTLVDQRPSELKQNDIGGQEFVLALQTLQHTSPGKTQQSHDLLLRIIWRRCLIRDDWKTLDSIARKSDQDATDDLESTALFKTIYEGYATGLWNPSTGIRPLPPSDVLGAGTTPDSHRDRFPTAALREPIARDLAVEDAILQHHISKCRLDHWVATAEAWAQERLRREGEARAERGEKVARVEEEIKGEDKEFEYEVYQGGVGVPGARGDGNLISDAGALAGEGEVNGD